MNDTSANAPTLRYGLTCLWPSEIADQFYCEYKVHLKRLHPEVQVEMPPLELGEVSHAALVSQAEPVTRAEIEQSIRTGKKLVICEWMLEGRFNGIPIRGRPDFFAFEGKNALLLLEFKFSAAKQPFPDHEVQAETYALLTQSMEFSTEQLCVGIVLFPPGGLGGSLGDAALNKAAMLQYFNENGTLHKISEKCQQARKALLTGRTKRTKIKADGWNAFLFRYDPSKAARDLSWALAYWLQEREPIPVKRWPRKCFACPLNAVGLCEHALQRPDPCFNVQRRADGQLFVYR
jgi:hypothetical protein